MLGRRHVPLFPFRRSGGQAGECRLAHLAVVLVGCGRVADGMVGAAAAHPGYWRADGLGDGCAVRSGPCQSARRGLGMDSQTLAAEQVREGKISSDALRDHPLRNVLTQAVGTSEIVKPFVRTEKIQSGDIFLLCSDGLYEVVSDRVLLRMIDGSNESQKVVDSLVQKSIEGGSTDNVTALIAYITN